MLTSARWWIILHAQGYRIRFLLAVGYRVVSLGVSYFTPGPQFGGEPVQVYYLYNRHSIPVSSGIASFSLDKIIELLANFLFLLIGAYFALQTRSILQISYMPVVITLALPFLLLLGYSIAIWTGRHPLSRLFERLPFNHSSYIIIKSTIVSTEQQMSDFGNRN